MIFTVLVVFSVQRVNLYVACYIHPMRACVGGTAKVAQAGYRFLTFSAWCTFNSGHLITFKDVPVTNSNPCRAKIVHHFCRTLLASVGHVVSQSTDCNRE